MHAISRARLPQRFVQFTMGAHGEPGERWLNDIPALVAACEEHFRVRVTGMRDDVSYSLVLWANAADGTPAVLKLGIPSRQLRAEAQALQLYGGRAAVRLLAEWPVAGALLLERAVPGDTLRERAADDRSAMEAVATVARELWVPAPRDPIGDRVASWAARGFAKLRRRFDGGTGPLPAPLVERAERLFGALLSDAPAPQMIHGDLHYGNLVAAERRPWLAIDVKGALGEPAFDAGYLLGNPALLLDGAGAPSRQTLADRIAFLPGALGLDRDRVVAYAFAQAVLGAWWTVEDHGEGWETGVAIAQLLAAEVRD